MAPKNPPSKDTKAKPKPPKYKNIPTGLAQSHIDDLDAVAKTENLTRSEVVRRAVEEFVANYNADKLDARQSQLEKRMKTMETALRALLVKSIRLNGQVLYFTVLPYTHGIPKQRLSAKGFQTLYEKSAYFAGQFLQSKAASKIPSDLDFTDAEEQDEQAGEKSE